MEGSELGADLDGQALSSLGTLEELNHGDDYELLFTLAAGSKELLMQRAGAWDHPLLPIGVVSITPGLRMDGTDIPAAGWDHFR